MSKHRVHCFDRNQIMDLLNEDKSSTEISKILTGTENNYSMICKFIRDNDLVEYYQKKNKSITFDSIDTKEKAYIIGFISADGHRKNKSQWVCSLALKDKNILEFIANYIGCNVIVDNTVNRKQRKFPKCTIVFSIKDSNKFVGSELSKKERNIINVSPTLEQYLLRGIFDADGCITWGRRKDRNRIWHKVSFSSSFKILATVQKILYKKGITTRLYKVNKENCYCIDFTNKQDILKFYDCIYQDSDFIVCKRKYDNFNALRLELGENEETTQKSTISCQATSHEVEGVETTGGKMGSLNNQQEYPSLIEGKK